MRKLDQLFAERVMGYEVVDDIEVFDLPKVVDGEFVSTGQRTLPHYTSSLDAAWEGASRIGKRHLQLTWMADGTRSDVEVWPADKGAVPSIAPNPAHALVLACLRAVGVTEAEIASASE